MTPRQALGYALIGAMGVVFYVLFEHVDSSIVKGLGLAVGSAIISYAVDLAVLRREKAKGEIH